MFCSRCGTSNPDENAFCQSCGAPLRAGAGPGAAPPPPSADARGLETGEKALIFLGNFCVSPILGLVLFFVWKDPKPRKSREVCVLTLWSVGAWFVLFFLFFVFAGIVGALAER